MKNKSPSPIEIQKFFADEYGKTLLIKGTPGSGKTAFALTLLSTLKVLISLQELTQIHCTCNTPG